MGGTVWVYILQAVFYAATAALLGRMVSVVSHWCAYYMEDDELADAIQGLRLLLVRGRQETELLLRGDYSRRVAVGYVFQDLAKFSEGQSYLNVYLRQRARAASERAIAEWEDRRHKSPAAIK